MNLLILDNLGVYFCSSDDSAPVSDCSCEEEEPAVKKPCKEEKGKMWVRKEFHSLNDLL